MPRTIRYWLATVAAAAVLAWAAWPGAPGNPATLISRVDVCAIVLMLAGLPLVVRRRFGGMGSSWAARLLRMVGYAVVFALMLVKADVERFELRSLSGTALAGVWVGEVAFLIVIAAYVCALLAATSGRPPANTATLAIGTGAGVALGIAVYVLRPLINYVHVPNPWLGGLYGLAKIAAIVLVLYAAVRAAIAAARRTARRDGALPLTEVRARQGLAAGLCVGIAAALLVSVLGITTIALLPHLRGSIQWTLPGDLLAPARGQTLTPDAISDFEASFSQAAAGYLLVLIVFPVLGAGLGAWGGLFAAGNSGYTPGGGGGGGGGGPDDPDPEPVPPGGGLGLVDVPGPAPLDLGWDALEEFPELAAPDRAPEREPAGVP